jgi:uncharacterized Zn-finger protein
VSHIQFVTQNVRTNIDAILFLFQVSTLGNDGSICDICGKVFCSKFTLKRHYQTHSGNYKYNCELCGLGFVAKCYLDTHVGAKHTAVKLFTCDICERSFGYKSNLTAHKRSFHAITQ